MKRMIKLLTVTAGVFAFAFGIGFSSPQASEANHCQSQWSCGCNGNPDRAYEKVYCDGVLVSTKCYNITC